MEFRVGGGDKNTSVVTAHSDPCSLDNSISDTYGKSAESPVSPTKGDASPPQNDVDFFRSQGYCVLENILPSAFIDSLYHEAIDRFENLTSVIARENLHFGVGVKNGFKEIVQRHPLRYEMAYEMDSPVMAAAITEISTLPRVQSVVEGVLGEPGWLCNKSVVISEAGAGIQAWHSDGPHVSTTEHLPCHVFNMFLPLVDISKENGGTEIRPESQVLTRDLTKMYVV